MNPEPDGGKCFQRLKKFQNDLEIPNLGILICWHVAKGYSYSTNRFTIDYIMIIPTNVASLNTNNLSCHIIILNENKNATESSYIR